MNNFKNKYKIFFKKFLCSTFITLFLILNGVNILSFASAEPPPYAPTSFVGEVGNGISKAIQQIAKYYFGQKDSPITIDNVTKEVSEQITETMSHIINITYPIGSIYMSINDVNPATIFGGIWERWGAGRVPVGVNATQSEFSSVEQTGGSRTHTHTLDSAAAMIGSDWGRTDTLAFSARNVGNLGATTYVLQTHNRAPDARGRSHNTALTGTTDSSPNFQPYITCYMWKRIA